MASLEGVKVKSGTFYRVVYYWQGKRERVKIGVTTRRVANQQKSKIETLLASGINPLMAIKYSNQVDDCINLTDLLYKNTKWCTPRFRPRTLEANEAAMRKLIGWAGNIPIQTANEDLIEQFLQYLSENLNLKSSSINIHLRQLKAVFQRTVKKHKLIKVHLFKSITPHQLHRQTDKPKFLTKDQIDLRLCCIKYPHFLK